MGFAGQGTLPVRGRCRSGDPAGQGDLPVRVRQARSKLSAEPARSVARAVPASLVEVVVRIAPDGVNTSVKELSVFATGSSAPCQVPWKETTHPPGRRCGVPPVSLRLVFEPLVVYQPCTAPVSSKV